MKNERQTVKILKRIARKRGLSLIGYSDDWLIKVYNASRVLLIHGYKFGVNDAASAATADDKTTLYEVLSDVDISAVPHYFISAQDGVVSPYGQRLAYDLFEKYGKLVLKPNNGTGGIDVKAVSDRLMLDSELKKMALKYDMIAVSPYVNVEREYRVVVYKCEPQIRYYKMIVDPDEWRHNLAFGAIPQDIDSAEVINKLDELAIRAIKAVGLEFASVDIVEVEGRLSVLEINSGVMTEKYSESSIEREKKVEELFDRVVCDWFEIL